MASELDRALERVGERLRNPTIIPPEDLPVKRRAPAIIPTPKPPPRAPWAQRLWARLSRWWR